MRLSLRVWSLVWPLVRPLVRRQVWPLATLNRALHRQTAWEGPDPARLNLLLNQVPPNQKKGRSLGLLVLGSLILGLLILGLLVPDSLIPDALAQPSPAQYLQR